MPSQGRTATVQGTFIDLVRGGKIVEHWSEMSFPEFMQALGDLYLFDGNIGEAKPWHDRALTAYLASVEHDEVLYFHHLAGFYADSLNDPEKAVEWARRDLFHTVTATERGKPVVSPAGQPAGTATRKRSPWDSGYGIREQAKAAL